LNLVIKIYNRNSFENEVFCRQNLTAFQFYNATADELTKAD